MGRDRPDLVGPVDPADLEARGPAVRAGRDRVAPANLADRVAPANLADRVARVDRAGPGDTNRAVREVMADMNPADRAAQVDLADPADMSLGARADRALRDRVLEDRAARELSQDRVLGLSRAHLGRTAPSRARLRRAALSRVHRHRMPADLHRMRAGLHLMPADPHRIPDHLLAPTPPGVATRLPVPTRLAEAIHPAEETHPATREADSEGVKPCYCEFSLQSSGFGRATGNFSRAQVYPNYSLLALLRRAA